MTPGVDVPYTRPALWPEVRPGRFAATLRRESTEGCRAALLGLPDDLGVQLNAGRTGARGGPEAFRASLARFGVAWDGLRGKALDVGVFDAGDVVPAEGADEAALFETHRRIESAAAYLQERGLVTLCVGGGHDLSLPSLRAAARQAGHPLGGVNVDAHLDVRERVGSGMPFRALIEGKHLAPQRFVELGLGRFTNDRVDLEWLSRQGATLLFAETLLERGLDVDGVLDAACRAGAAFLSIDLDGLDQNAAPGVSAPNPLGVSVRDAARLAEAAGARPEIRHFDLMELNPRYDVDARTARTATLLLLCFLAGLSERRV
jgi:formimidoylglutamase